MRSWKQKNSHGYKLNIRGKMQDKHFHDIEKIEDSYWWFQARYTIVKRLLKRYNKINPEFLLDWGCGTGGFLNNIMHDDIINPEKIFGVDSSIDAQKFLQRKNIPYCILKTESEFDDLTFSSMDVITMLDVLEHIEHPVQILQKLFKASKDGAVLIVFVPAFQHLWSQWDCLLGHKRRYNKGYLKIHLSAAGWRVNELRYIYNILYIPALFRNLLIKVNVMDEINFPNPPTFLNEILLRYFQMESKISALPFGTSLLAVAQKM